MFQFSKYALNYKLSILQSNIVSKNSITNYFQNYLYNNYTLFEKEEWIILIIKKIIIKGMILDVFIPKIFSLR